MEGTRSSMKEKRSRSVTKRIVAMIITAALTLTLIPFMGDPIGAYADDVFDKTQDNTGLGTGSIANPASGAGGWSYVYYGTYNSNSVKYRVLDKAATEFGSNTMLLDCDSTLINMAHDSQSPYEYGANGWANSEINAWLNGNQFYNNASVFTAQEKAAIAASPKSDFSNDGQGRDYLDSQNLTEEHVFLLDAKEATRESYGYASNAGDNATRVKSGTSSWWWLRSPDSVYDSPAGFVNTAGSIGDHGVHNNNGVSPAFNVNLSSVIFSSVVDGTAGAAGAKYKLTLKDTSKSVGITSGSNITRSGSTITIPYTVAGDNVNRISVLVTDKAYTEADATIKSYGKLVVSGAIGTSGTGTYELPASYDASTDKVYIIAEQVGASTVTDYAGTPVLITVPDDDGASPGPGPAPIVKTPEKKSEIGSHTHSYSWVVTKSPTSTSDGEEAYMCSCGEIERISILPAISAFEEETINKIKNAPANAVIEVETSLFNSFGIGVRDALAARPDVTLKVSFLEGGFRGQRLKLTIPAGKDRDKHWDENGWLGLCRAGTIFGYDQ